MNTRILFLCRSLSILSFFFIVIIPTTVILIWITGSESTLLSSTPQYWFIPIGIRFQPGALTDTIRITGAGISIIANLPLLLALWQLHCLFELYTKLDIFQREAASRLKKFAAYILVFALLQPITGAVISLVTSMNNAVGHRVLSISIVDTDIATILLGATICVIASVLEDAQRLADENNSFV